MQKPFLRKVLILLGTFGGICIVIRYLLPVFLPFLLGAALALAAESTVHFLQSRLHIPRGAAAGIGVSLAFAILVLLLMILGTLLLRELGSLAGFLPEAQKMVQKGLTSLEDWLLQLASNAPAGISPMLTQTVLELFSGGTALLSRITDTLLGLAAWILGRIPDGALGFGTALISSYMISAKLPKIRSFLKRRIPEAWRNRYLPAAAALKSAIGCWLRAQAKLLGITFLIVTAGLLALRIRHAPFWAGIIAIVDAVPLLGTGTIMVPWALVCLLQGNQIRCIGLLAVYAAAAMTRSVLEPRLVGKQMGIDPLLTLIAMYLGYRLWGVLGMLLSPMAAAAALSLAELRANGNPK